MFPTKLPGDDFINSWYPIAIALVIGVVFGFRKYMQGPECRSQEKIAGKNVIITGANKGIGRETAKELLFRGAKVIIACRNEAKGKETVAELKAETKKDSVVFMKLDLASLKSIREFVENYLEAEDSLEILINNAGVMCHPQAKTEDGIELHFGTNYLGHFLLTQLLLDELKSSAPSRIINVTAPAYNLGEMNLDDLNYEKTEYKPGDAYARSKLAIMMFTDKLSKALEGTNVTVNSVNPGIANTDIYCHMPFKQSKFVGIAFAPFMYFLMKRAQDAAQTVVYCAVAKEEEGVSGKLYSDCTMKEPGDVVKNEETAQKLWDLSLEMAKIKA